MNKLNVLELLRYGQLLHAELQKCESLLDGLSGIYVGRSELLREKIKKLREDIKDVDRLVKKIDNFHREEFLDFAVKLLNQDGSNYVLTKTLIFDHKSTQGKFHYFISDEAMADFLQKDVSYKSDLDNLINVGMLKNTIHFSEDNFSLLDDNYNINSELCKSKLLKEASIKAMQIKLDNPYITNEQRLDTILEDNKKELTK